MARTTTWKAKVRPCATMNEDQVISRQYKRIVRNSGEHQTISDTTLAVMEGGSCSSCSSNTCGTTQWSRDDLTKLIIYLLKWLYSRGQCNNDTSVISRELEGIEGTVIEEGVLVQSDLQKLLQLLFYLLRNRCQRCSCCGQPCPSKTYSSCNQSCCGNTL